MVDGDTASSDRFKEINNSFSKIENISIYDGVDRSLFENGVALTGPTVSKFTSSGKNWSDDLFSRLFSPTEEYKWTDYLAFYLLPTLGSALIFSGLVLTNFVIEKIIIRCSSEVVRSAAKNIEKLIIVNTREQLERGVMRNHFFRYMAYGKGLFIRGESMLYRIVAAVRCAFFVLTIAMTIVSIVMLFVTIFEDGESGPAKYDPVPNHIVDTVSTKHGDDYIAYNYVKNTLGSAGDLNNYIGRSGWLMLYYTKDRAAGEPITDDFRVVKGSSNPPLDYEGISIFGSTNAANITSEEYTGVKDPTGGTYIYFSRGNSYATGSAISGGYLAIVIGLGVCGGILIGTISSRISSKKKKALA
ncbi:MAG: hypothetical protein HUJ65_02745 [Oscillospiraceae bacterium]|nr:hypothetical protein [Oscillospiraceae bacterium]